MEKTVVLIPFLLSLSSAFQVSVNGPCPNGWAMSGRSCYKFIAQEATWFDAYEICKLAGGHMVTIQSSDEDSFVRWMAQYKGVAVWIGLNDFFEEGRFVWSDTKYQLVPTYTNWLSGEPNNKRGEENCGMVFNNGLWNDESCYSKYPTICEKDIASQ